MAAAMQVTPDAADIAACILLQRHFRGNRCRGKVTRSELGVRSLRTNAGEAGGHGLRLVQLLQLRRVASASPSTRSDQDIDVVGRVFGDLESAACNPQLEQPFFASMDEGQRRELHRHLQLAPLRQTEYLFHQGDLSNDTFYYVVSGTVGVALVEDEASGRHTIVKRLGAGATFGENALATDVPAALRTSTIVGVEDCMLGTITRSAYLLTTGELARYVVSALKTHPDERARTEIQLIVELLKETAFVKQLGQLGDLPSQVARCCTHLRLNQNELLFRHGDDADTFYIIVRGYVRVVIEGQCVVNLGPGQSFGELGVTGKTKDARRRTATVIGGFVPDVKGGPPPPPGGAGGRGKREKWTELAVLSRADYQRLTSATEARIRRVLQSHPAKRTEGDLTVVRDMFGQTHFFRTLSTTTQVLSCCRNLGMVLLGAGERLFSAGDDGDIFYIIVRGEVTGQLGETEGKKFQLGAGDAFGEISVMGKTAEERKRTATVTASSECLLATLSRANYLRVTNGLEEQALKTLGRDPERRTEQDAKVLASYLQDITFFTELHFPMMQMAACRELQLQCADCGDLLFSEGDDSEGRLYLLLRGTLRVLVKVHGEGGGADDSGGGGGVDEERGMTEAGVAVSEVSEVSEEVERYTPLQAFSDSAHAMSVDGESTTSEALRVNRTVEVLQPPAETKHPQQVLVQGIPNAWNVKHVYESFCVFGPVLAVDMYKNQSGMGLQLGKDLGSEIQLSHETNVATVTFTKPAHAQQAIREKLVVELDSDTLMPVQAAGNGRRQTRKTKQQAQSMAGFWSKAKLHVASRKRGDVGGMLINLESSLHQKHMLGHDAMVAILTRQAFLDSVHSILTSVLAVLDKPPQQRSLKELTLVRNFMECTDFYRGFPASEMIQRSCSRCLKKVVVMPGEVIYRQGATADRTFIIIRGTVQLEQTGDAGRDQPNQHSSSRLPMSVNGVIDMPSAAQVQVEGIGVDGWDGTRKGVGRYENEASLQKIFAAYGEMLGITIHHRVREQQNTSWAVVTFANGSAVTRCLEAKVVMAGSNVLTVTRAELQNSSDDADNTQLCEEEHQRSQTLTAGAHFGDETNKRKTRTSYRHTAKAVSGAVLACLSKQDYWRVCSTDSMQAVINRFFKLAVHHSSDSVQSTQLVDFDGYRQLYLRLGKVIATQERFSAKELRNSMHQDWDEDLHKFGDPENNPETMTLSQFSESMFELVDSWCGGVESTELYSNLLQTILDESTQSIPHAEPPDNLEFKPASKVRCCYQQLMNQRAEFQKKEKVAKAKAYKEDVQREQFKKSDADAMKVMAAKGMFGLSHAAAGGGAPKVRDEKAAAAAMREKYYRDMFDSVDQDGSGALDREEVAQLAFNMLGRQLNDFELDAAMLEMDPDGDANVDFDEFKAWFKEKTEGEALLQQLFESADDDGSGLLEREEVRKVMLELGYDLSQDELDAAMAEMDADGSGGVDYDEFAKWWRKVTSNETMMLHKEPAEEEYYRNMFDQFDEDGSGELDAEEVRALMKALGRELSDYELTTAMGLMDEDGGGTVCWEEFLKWFGWLTDSDLSVRQIFEAIDGDGSGSLDADECRLAVMRLCKESDGVQLSEEEVESAVRLMDRDGNGDVDCDEFAEWWSVWQFRKRNAPDDPVVAYYRDCFDELAFRHASEQVARQYPFPTDDVVDVAEEVRTSARKALEGQVLQGQGRIGHDHLMQLCAALGRPLYPHEQTWAISAIDPHNNGIVFETFKLWFDKLRAMDTTLQQLFSHVDSSQGLAHIQGHGRVLLPDRNKSKGLPTPVGFVGPSGVRTLLQVERTRQGVDAANHWDGCFSEATGQATTHGSVMTTTASKQTTALEQQLDSTARMRWEFWWLRHREDVELALAATPGQRAAGSLDTLQELLRLSQMGNASLSDVAVERHCCQHMGHQRFRTGQTVCTVGEIGVDAWFLVLSGGVRVTRHQPPPPESGRAPEPASLTLQPGDSFGELCATGESVEVRRCAVTAVAVDDCLLVAITHAIYRDVSHCQVSDKEFADALASMQSYRRGLWQRRRQGTATMPSHSLGASSSLTVAKLSPRRMLLLGQAPGEGVLGTLRPPRKGEIDFDTFRWWWTSQQDHRMRMKQEQREHVQGGPRSSRTGAVSPGHSVVVPGQGQLGTAPPMMKTAPPEESAKAPKARALRAAKRNEVLALLHGKDRRVRRQSRSRQLRVLQRLQERERPSTAVGTGSREELATREGHSTSRQSQSGQVELFRNRSEEEIATAWQMFSQQGRHASSLADSSPRQSMSSHHSQQLLGVSVGAAAFDQSSLTLEEQMRPSTALGLLPPHGHGGSGAVVAPMSSSAAWPPRLGQRQSTFGEGTRTDVSVILRNRSQQGRQRRRQQQAREDQGTAATAQQHGWQGSAQLLVSTRLGAQSTSCQILDDYYRYPYSRPPPTPSKRSSMPDMAMLSGPLPSDDVGSALPRTSQLATARGGAANGLHATWRSGGAQQLAPTHGPLSAESLRGGGWSHHEISMDANGRHLSVVERLSAGASRLQHAPEWASKSYDGLGQRLETLHYSAMKVHR